MRAPSYASLYTFEDSIEAACAAVFATAGLNCNVSASTAELATPRVEIQLIVNQATGHLGENPQGDGYPDFFNGTLKLAVVTKRFEDPLSPATYRGKMRSLLYRFDEVFVEELLPYHSVQEVIEIGTTFLTDAETLEDTSIVTWKIQFAIRPGAWPLTIDEIQIGTPPVETHENPLVTRLLNSTATINLNATQRGVPDVGGNLYTLIETYSAVFAAGAGLNQADYIWTDLRTLAPAASEDIDICAPSELDQLGDPIALTKIKLVLIKNRGALPGEDLWIGGGSGSGSPSAWNSPFGASDTAQMRIPAGGSLVLIAPDAAGFAAAPGSNQFLTIENHGTAAIEYDIAILAS
jgi:hypothetical protein